jgi:hypothetical protein
LWPQALVYLYLSVRICTYLYVYLYMLLWAQALVYLYEVAPEQRKGLMSALGCVCLALGVALGVLVVAAVAHFMPPGRRFVTCWKGLERAKT